MWNMKGKLVLQTFASVTARFPTGRKLIPAPESSANPANGKARWQCGCSTKQFNTCFFQALTFYKYPDFLHPIQILCSSYVLASEIWHLGFCQHNSNICNIWNLLPLKFPTALCGPLPNNGRPNPGAPRGTCPTPRYPGCVSSYCLLVSPCLPAW